MKPFLKHVSLVTLVTFIQFAIVSPVSFSTAQDRSRAPSPSAPMSSSTASTSEDTDADVEDAEVMTLRIGDISPMDGTLFSVAAAARILTNLEFTKETCQIRLNEQLRLQEAHLRLEIDTEHARFVGLEFRHNEMIRVRDEQITFLTSQIRPRQWYESVEFWFGMGSLIGVVVTVAAGYALSLVNN